MNAISIQLRIQENPDDPEEAMIQPAQEILDQLGWLPDDPIQSPLSDLNDQSWSLTRIETTNP